MYEEVVVVRKGGGHDPIQLNTLICDNQHRFDSIVFYPFTKEKLLLSKICSHCLETTN